MNSSRQCGEQFETKRNEAEFTSSHICNMNDRCAARGYSIVGCVFAAIGASIVFADVLGDWICWLDGRYGTRWGFAADALGRVLGGAAGLALILMAIYCVIGAAVFGKAFWRIACLVAIVGFGSSGVWLAIGVKTTQRSRSEAYLNGFAASLKKDLDLATLKHWAYSVMTSHRSTELENDLYYTQPNLEIRRENVKIKRLATGKMALIVIWRGSMFVSVVHSRIGLGLIEQCSSTRGA